MDAPQARPGQQPAAKRQRVETEALTIPGPAGTLEALIDRLDAEPQALAVVCHPHPQSQGTMHNKVAHSLSRSFARLGALAVRFNYRGVGASSGHYAGGDGETDDANAVVSWARSQWPGKDLYLAGFSFGAMVSLRAAASAAASGLISVAPAVHKFQFEFRHPRCPWLIIQGVDDEIVSADAVLAWSERLDPPPRLELLADTGHYFHGRLNRLDEIVAGFFGGGFGTAAGSGAAAAGGRVAE